MRFADLRYVGQGHKLKVPIADGVVDAAALASLWIRFPATHAAEYGHAFESCPIEVGNLRLTAVGHLAKLDGLPTQQGGNLKDALL